MKGRGGRMDAPIFETWLRRCIRLLTSAVADVVGLPSTRTDHRITVTSAEVETISTWTGAWNTAERSFDVVAVPRQPTVVSSKSTLIVVCSIRKHSTPRPKVQREYDTVWYISDVPDYQSIKISLL